MKLRKKRKKAQKYLWHADRIYSIYLCFSLHNFLCSGQNNIYIRFCIGEKKMCHSLRHLSLTFCQAVLELHL